MACWRPTPQRRSIWELALHVAYWDYAVRRRLAAGGPNFPRRPANFPHLPAEPTEGAWTRDRAVIAREHRLLVEAIEAVPVSRYHQRAPGSKRWTCGELILGIGQHDAYHTGQIQVIKRLWSERGFRNSWSPR